MNDDRIKLGIELGLDRVLAHQVLFKHRHKNQTPHFHREIIEDFHGPHPQVAEMAFRGGAKSTIFEEGAIIRAIYREFKNGLLLGATSPLAEERLQSIKHEFETNEQIEEIFGSMIGPIWTADELVLSNGVRIIARSRNQGLRGTKFQDQRPDFVLIDDIEDDEDSRDIRNATKRWFMTTLMPALDPLAIMRVAATPVDPDALAEDIRRDPTWKTRAYPIKYRDDSGAWAATWPDRFPLERIERIEVGFSSKGMMREFNMEYMCIAAADSDRVFKENMIRIEPQVRSWQAVYGMFDPARTTNKDSATTGFAAWSWIGPKLVIWASWARKLMPDEIIKALFDFDTEFNPVWVGIEEDGLNEFLLQPIRQEVVKRGHALPLRPERAPRGKIQFIQGLQPFFKAREVVFATPQADMKAQLLSFPTGTIDAPNALAYALRMRPGAPIYDGFGNRHIAEGLIGAHGTPWYLCLNANGNTVTGVLAQIVEGALRVYGDYAREGDADTHVANIVHAAQMDAGRPVRITLPPEHFERYSTTGLVAAVRRLPAEARRGVPAAGGRSMIRDLMQREHRGAPMVMISSEARWTLNGFSAGYARAMNKGGHLADYAEDNTYRVLCEGLESFVGILRTGAADDSRDDLSYSVTTGGRRYVTAMPQRG